MWWPWWSWWNPQHRHLRLPENRVLVKLRSAAVWLLAVPVVRRHRRAVLVAHHHQAVPEKLNHHLAVQKERPAGQAEAAVPQAAALEGLHHLALPQAPAVHENNLKRLPLQLVFPFRPRRRTRPELDEIQRRFKVLIWAFKPLVMSTLVALGKI